MNTKKPMPMKEVSKEIEKRFGSTPAFIEGQFKDPKTCPKSKDGKCPKCGSALEPGYGIGTGYGFGSYNFCQKCGVFYDFVEDKG